MQSVTARFTLVAAFPLLLLACARPVVSATPVPAPALPPVSAAPLSARFALPAILPATSYAVRVHTQLERDSAGRIEQDVVESSARVQLTLRRDARGALRGSGRVDSFSVTGTGATARASVTRTTTSAALAAPQFTSVLIDAALDSTLVRAVVRPPLANECDRPEAAAAAVARDLLVRVPPSVAVGDQWRDSLVTFVCRGGVPMTVRMTIASVVTGARDNRLLRLRRTLSTSVEGNSRTPWRQVEISGVGRGTQEITIDLERGTLDALDGESTLTIRVANGSLRDATRTQQVVQTVTMTARAIRP